MTSHHRFATRQMAALIAGLGAGAIGFGLGRRTAPRPPPALPAVAQIEELARQDTDRRALPECTLRFFALREDAGEPNAQDLRFDRAGDKPPTSACRTALLAERVFVENTWEDSGPTVLALKDASIVRRNPPPHGGNIFFVHFKCVEAKVTVLGATRADDVIHFRYRLDRRVHPAQKARVDRIAAACNDAFFVDVPASEERDAIATMNVW